MNDRLPIFALLSARESEKTAHSVDQLSTDWPQAKWQDAKFFRSSFVYDFKTESARKLNRSALFGLALSLGISASFWSAAAFLFMRYSR